MALLQTSLVCVAICLASQAASAAADATVSLEVPRLTIPAVLQLHAVPQSVPKLQEHVPSQTLPSDYDKNVRRAGRGRILLAAGVPLLVFGTPLVAWAATADDCYSPGDDLSGSVIAGSVMVGTGFVLTSAGIAQLVRAGKKARRSDQAPPRFRHWAIPIGFASGLLSIGVFLTGFIGGSIGCYSS
ncbi:MAG: hypothetical protein WAU39_14905 [Polyangiales bacterium]